MQAALNGSFVTITIDGNEHPDPVIALTNALREVQDILHQCLNHINCVKFYVVAQAKLQKAIDDEVSTTFGFWCKTKVLLQDSNLTTIMAKCRDEILKNLESFQERGSGSFNSFFSSTVQTSYTVHTITSASFFVFFLTSIFHYSRYH